MFSQPTNPIRLDAKSITLVFFPNCDNKILAPFSVKRLSEKLK